MARRDAGRQRGDAIVQRVLQATLEELADPGPDRLSVERVAQRAEVNKTTVYRRWRRREDLVAAAMVHFAESVGELPDRGSLQADLIEVVMTIGAFVQSVQGQALARVALTATPRAALDSLIAERFGRPGTGAPPLVERSRERGEWSSTADPGQVMSLLAGAVLHRALLEHAPISESWAASLVSIVVNGITEHGTSVR